MFIEKYISFLIVFFVEYLITSSGHGFCSGREDDYSNDYNINDDYGNSKNYISFNVLNYGAKGDGATNDAEAFVKTWSAACKTNGGVMLVPTGHTFLLQTVDFDGSSCQPNTVIQVDGKIVAPAKQSEWIKTDVQWIQFKYNSKGLTIKGNGVIDGRGESWWTNKMNARPHAMKITNNSNVIITGITIQNSPQMHLFVEGGQHLQIYNFTTLSPANSPNTDGIHISRFQHVEIHNSNLSCGDDCVSIQRGCFDVKIHDVHCGPGHGFSIGGLGPDNTEAEVSEISVYDSTIHNSLNGVRIKTWPVPFKTSLTL